MSPFLPLLPEPMVNIWPSNSLQAPTSYAFLRMVALAPLPWPPWPRPAHMPFPLHPSRLVLEVQAIFFIWKAPRMVGRWLLQKNPWIKYPGFCRAISSVGSCESTFLQASRNHMNPLLSPVLSWRSPVFPNKPVRLVFFARLPRQACTRCSFCECVGGI
jgi:hypothetical protein